MSKITGRPTSVAREATVQVAIEFDWEELGVVRLSAAGKLDIPPAGSLHHLRDGGRIAGCRGCGECSWEDAMPLPFPVAPPGPPGSLADALAAVPEPRRPNGWLPDRTPLPLVGVLQ